MSERKRGLLYGIVAAAMAVGNSLWPKGQYEFWGPSSKAWLANGLDELRQAFAFGSTQIQAGMNPGLWGTITTGEATAERMAGENEEVLNMSKDVPKLAEPGKKYSLEQLRGIAREHAAEAEQQMDRGNDQNKSQDHDQGHDR